MFGSAAEDFTNGVIHFKLNLTEALPQRTLTICVPSALMGDPCHLTDTTTHFEVVNNNESKLVITSPPTSAALHELFSGDPVSSIQVGVSGFIEVELQDAYGNRIRDRTRMATSVDWWGHSVTTLPDPTAQLSVLVTKNTNCAMDTRMSLFSCSDRASGCLTDSPGAYMRVEDTLSMVSPCGQTVGSVSLNDGRAKIVFRIDSTAQNYRVEACPLQRVSPCQSNATSSLSASCSNGLAKLACSIQTAATGLFEVLPGLIVAAVVDCCSANQTFGNYPMIVGQSHSCTMNLQDKYENLVDGTAGTATWSLTIVFNGIAIPGLESIAVALDQGKLAAAVPESTDDFTSVLTSPGVDVRLQYALNLQSSPDNALEPVFTHTFDIIH